VRCISGAKGYCNRLYVFIFCPPGGRGVGKFYGNTLQSHARKYCYFVRMKYFSCELLNIFWSQTTPKFSKRVSLKLKKHVTIGYV